MAISQAVQRILTTAGYREADVLAGLHATDAWSRLASGACVAPVSPQFDAEVRQRGAEAPSDAQTLADDRVLSVIWHGRSRIAQDLLQAIQWVAGAWVKADPLVGCGRRAGRGWWRWWWRWWWCGLSKWRRG